MSWHPPLKESRYPYAVVVLVLRDEQYEEKLVSFLHELGYEVRVADEAIRAINLVQFEFELTPVILITEYDIDPELRVYDGISLIKHLKGRKIFPIAPYYVMDSYDDVLFGEALAAGAEMCFTKYMPDDSKKYNLGEFFKQAILGARDILRLYQAKNLDRLTSKPGEGVFVYNKQGGEEYFEHIWREAERTKMMPSAVAIDFVGFRGANEEGHDDGDRLIGEVVEVIVRKFKSTDLIIRGHEKGDEVDIIMPTTSARFAEKAVKRVLAEVEGRTFYLSSGKPFTTRFRYGISTADRRDIGLPAKDVLKKICKEANGSERKEKAKT